MIMFFIFSIFLLLGVTLLVVWPILAHPTLPPKKKLLFSALGFVLLFPLGIVTYLMFGVPSLAGNL